MYRFGVLSGLVVLLSDVKQVRGGKRPLSKRNVCFIELSRFAHVVQTSWTGLVA